MFIVFEGIDGSGKTTLAGHVSAALEAAGVSVYQARPKGLLRSKLASQIRDLARDPRGLDMSARTELMLFLARDAQMIDTVIRDATLRADVVFADRYLYSAMSLCQARGALPPGDIRAAAEIVAGGLWPDLVIYCDVDIFTSNNRKRIERWENPRPPWDFGRKGLGGLGVRRSIREAYLAMAEADPRRWFVVDNAQGTIADNTRRIVERILAALGRPANGSAKRESTIGQTAPLPRHSGEPGREAETVAAFYEALERLVCDGQARLALYHARSLDSDAAWALRERFKAQHAPVVAMGLEPLGSDRAVALRDELVEAAPVQVARSLGAWSNADPRGFALRRRLAPIAPLDIAMSLRRIDSDEAWGLRDELAAEAPDGVLASLASLDTPRAWSLRHKLGKKKHDWGLLEGLAVLDSEPAWELRDTFLERAAPWVLLGLEGCDSPRAWRLRRDYLRLAPKLVLSSLTGLASPEAWEMRRATGRSCREALTTIKNDGSAPAFALREELAAVWPGFAAQSVGMTLAATPPGLYFLRSLVDANPLDLDVAHYYVKALEARAGRT